MRARACTVKSRGGPERGLSSPACVGSGAAGDTEMLARGPPSAIWESTRVCAVPATAKRADKSAVANVTAIKVRAARPGRRPDSRPARRSRRASHEPASLSAPARPSAPSASLATGTSVSIVTFPETRARRSVRVRPGTGCG